MGMIPLTNHDSRAQENSEVVMKFTQIYIIYIYTIYTKSKGFTPSQEAPRAAASLTFRQRRRWLGFDRNIRNPKPAKGEVLPYGDIMYYMVLLYGDMVLLLCDLL